MRSIVICCFFVVLTTVGFSQTQSVHHEISWEESFENAKELAKSSNKPILIFFTGSDWCRPCMDLVADFFSSTKFEDLTADKFILYEADFPRHKRLVTMQQVKDNNRLKNKYNVGVFPTVVIIDPKGKRLGHISGYNSARDIRYHVNLLQTTLTKWNSKNK